MFSYVTFLTTFPMMIISNIFYPFPSEEKRWKIMIQGGLAMLDFLDMGELIISDVGCIINYDARWICVFFVAIGVSTILLTTSLGLEHPSRLQDKEGKCFTDCIVTVLNMIFNDGLFFTIRIYVMVQEKHIYFGLIFVIKEFFAFFFRLALVIVYCKK